MSNRRLLGPAGALVLLELAGLIAGVGCGHAQPERKPPAEEKGQQDDPKRRGEADARKHIAANKLTLKMSGLRREWGLIYDQVLKERLGVESEVVADCDVDVSLAKYADAYNRLMEEEIARRFGPAALEEVAKETDKREEVRRKKMSP
jgi:hypothetical protein